MKQTKRTSVELLPDQLEAIQRIALELGYVQTRGVGIGKVGSMGQLMQAIARGEIQLTPKPPSPPATDSAALRKPSASLHR